MSASQPPRGQYHRLPRGATPHEPLRPVIHRRTGDPGYRLSEGLRDHSVHRQYPDLFIRSTTPAQPRPP